MLIFERWKVILCALAVLFGVVFTLPNVLPAGVMAKAPAWLPHQTLNLGLDLQGGSYLLEEVDTVALKAGKLNELVEDTRTTLRDQQIAFSGLALSNGVVNVHIENPGQAQAALTALQKLAVPVGTTGVREVQIVAGADQTIHLSISDQAMAVDTADAVSQDIEIVRKRIDSLGTREPSITRQGIDRIVIEAPGESDPEKLKSVIGQTAKLTFQMVDDTVTPEQMASGEVPPDDVVLPANDGPPMAVNRRAVVSGEMLTDARQSFDQNGRPAISFRFNGAGAKRFGDTTLQNVNKRFAIIIDNKILSAPVIQEAILGGSGEITGNFTAESASNLALELRSGALPAPLKAIEQRTVGAELGADSVKSGAIAGVIAIVLIGAFMILAYGLVFGGIAILGLIANMCMVIAAMTVGGATLTLPGIAGLILTIAMAVDANVLIYERIRDEERAGRKPAMAIDTGFSRATESILDANITTFISAMILFATAGGGGPVKGFAWTLSIGVVTSVFAALFITRMLVVWWYRASRSKQLPI
jgi:preprotein translocase subunit SecD